MHLPYEIRPVDKAQSAVFCGVARVASIAPIAEVICAGNCAKVCARVCL